MSTGMRSSSQASSLDREVVQAQPALGHELVAAGAGAVAVEQQRAGPAGAEQLARGELEQVAVLGWDRRVAQLAALLGARAPVAVGERGGLELRRAGRACAAARTRACPSRLTPAAPSATLTRPASSTSSGTGSRCSCGASRQRPARSTSKRLPQPGQVSSVARRLACSSDPPQPGTARGGRHRRARSGAGTAPTRRRPP